MSQFRQPPIPFTKMAGGGNDFVMIDARSQEVSSPERLTRAICTRRLSVGGDGLILLQSSAKATVRMRYFNSDGSAAHFCANGTRCLARFATLVGAAPPEMTIETGAGIIGATVSPEGVVTLTIGSPSGFERDRPLQLTSGRLDGSLIRVGVPHYVTFVDRPLWQLQIDETGRQVRTHRELAPEGANVNFVAVRDQHSIAVRTYERGVEGETLSCGSGVVASVAVSALFGRVESPVAVLTRSGIILHVTFERRGSELQKLTLSGDARVIYQSAIEAETLAGFDPDWVREPTDVAPQP